MVRQVKRALHITLLSLALVGCSSEISVKLEDAETTYPVSGLAIERYVKLNIFERVINPIRATYHPHKLAEAVVTDEKGFAVFENSSESDIYRFQIDGAAKLRIEIDDQVVWLKPHMGDDQQFRYIYSVWMEGGAVKYSARKLQEGEGRPGGVSSPDSRIE